MPDPVVVNPPDDTNGVNWTHAVAGGTGLGFGAALAGAISGTWHIDATSAADWVTVAAGVAATICSGVAWLIQWKYPTAPPLPMVKDTTTVVTTNPEGH